MEMKWDVSGGLGGPSLLHWADVLPPPMCIGGQLWLTAVHTRSGRKPAQASSAHVHRCICTLEAAQVISISCLSLTVGYPDVGGKGRALY